MKIFLADHLFGELRFLSFVNRVQPGMQFLVLFVNLDTFHNFHLRELLSSIIFQILYLLDCRVIYPVVKLGHLSITHITTTCNIVQSL